MADAPIAILQSFGALTLDNVAVITNNTRSIASIVPHVTLEETQNDSLSTTDHPVETGAVITDHSFRNPAELEMRLGWSDTTAQSVGFCEVMYQQLLALQNQRTPFPIQTGKRPYQNMLFRSLTVKTDQFTENALLIVAAFREVIIVKAASGSGGGGDAASQEPAADPDNQAEPQQTAPTENGGAVASQENGVPNAGPANSGSGTDTTTPNPYGDLSGVNRDNFNSQAQSGGDSGEPLTVHPNASSSGGANFSGSIGTASSTPSFAQGEGGAADPYYSSAIGPAKQLPTFAQ